MEWQPIETAPKDKEILLYSDSDGYGISGWNEEHQRWYVYNHYEEQLYLFPATHWMPLPDPPKEAVDKAGTK